MLLKEEEKRKMSHQKKKLEISCDDDKSPFPLYSFTHLSLNECSTTGKRIIEIKYLM